MTLVATLDRDQPLLNQPAVHDERDDLRTHDWRDAYRAAAFVLHFDDQGAALWAACSIGLAIVDREDPNEATIQWTAKEIERLVGRRGWYRAGGLNETDVRRPALRRRKRWWRA